MSDRVFAKPTAEGSIETSFAEDIQPEELKEYIAQLHDVFFKEKVENATFRNATKDVMLPLLANNFKEMKVDFGKLTMALGSLIPKLASSTKAEIIMKELQKVLDMMGIKFPIDELASMIEDEDRKAVICNYYES